MKLHMTRSLATDLAFLGAILAVTAAVPAPVAASSIHVDVRVASGGGWCGEETWVEFAPQRSGWVAVYAAYSDGSLQRVFPTSPGRTHWVDARDVRILPVSVPYGVRLVSVQAVASGHWFDPGDCRLVSAAPGPYGAWTFSIAWSPGSHSRTLVRSWGWGRPYGPRHPRYDKPLRVRTARPEAGCVVIAQAKTKHPKGSGWKQKSTRHPSRTKSKSTRR